MGLFDNELAALRKLNMSIMYLIIISTIVILTEKIQFRWNEYKDIQKSMKLFVKFLLLSLKLLIIKYY